MSSSAAGNRAVEDIRALAEPLLAAVSLALWDVEINRDVVRVLVDREGGVDLDALSEASAAVAGLLAERPDLEPEQAYQLEVSSPGLERSLRTPDQYRRYLGSQVSIKTTVAVEGSRRWQGSLAAVSAEGIEVRPDAGPQAVALRYDQIDRARTVLVWGPTPKAGGPRRKDSSAGGFPRRPDPEKPAGDVRTRTEVEDIP